MADKIKSMIVAAVEKHPTSFEESFNSVLQEKILNILKEVFGNNYDDYRNNNEDQASEYWRGENDSRYGDEDEDDYENDYDDDTDLEDNPIICSACGGEINDRGECHCNH